MLTKMIGGTKDFKKALKIKAAVSVLLIIAGGVTFAFALINSFVEGVTHFDEFTQGFYTGIGGGVLGSGIATLIRVIVLLKNPEKFKKAETEHLDERNHYIRNSAFALSGMIILAALYVATVVAGFMDAIVFKTLLAVLFGNITVLLGSYIILKKLR